MKRKGLFICCLVVAILLILFHDKIKLGINQRQMPERALALMVPSVVMPEDRPTETPEAEVTVKPTSKLKATATPKPTTAPKKDVSEPVATATAVPTAIPVEEVLITEKEPKATPYALALENQSGVQEGWGKVKSSITASLTLRSLPQQGAGSVKRIDSTQNASVIISSDMPLKLYGLYEGEKEKLYRHVGVTYLGTEYYGYILADRIEECAEEEIVLPTPTPTILPMPTAVPVIGPIPSYPSSPEPTATPVPFVPTMPPVISEPTKTPVPTATTCPVATSTPLPIVAVRPTTAPTATPSPVPAATPTQVPIAPITPVPSVPPVLPLPLIPTATPAPTATPVPAATPEPVYEPVSTGYYDWNVIPDRYNTGCYDTSVLQKINGACVVDGVDYKLGDNGNTIVIDLYYSKENVTLPDEVVIRNKDFSDKKFAVRHADMASGQKVIRFVNCKFASVATDADQDMVDFYFTNCTFENFYGSDCTFVDCFFGDTCKDGMNPFKNVTVQHCYFTGFPQIVTGGVHTDAMQVYGKADIDAENIVFSGCRIEIPIIKGVQGQAPGGINACLMVQLEFSNARNFLFEDCIINGGGYSIYAWDKDKGWVLDNVVFRNISIGSGHMYNDVYPRRADTVVFDNLYDTERLYVSSVWKDANGTIHLYVTNDTAEDRTLLVVTENGVKEVFIPSKATAEANGAKETSQLPIDIEVTISGAGNGWVVCYDGEETAENQIRYVNWSGEAVYRRIQ